MSKQQQQQVEQAEQVVIERLNTLEREIHEIRKAVTQEYVPEFPVIKQQQQWQQEQAEQEEFICTLCFVTKPIDERERKGKTKIKCMQTVC